MLMEATAKPEAIRDMAKKLKDTHRLMAISGIDEGGSITLCYHFWSISGKEITNLRLKVGKSDIQTISDIIPNALYYEREIHDLLGVEFRGAKLHPLLVPKGYKEYPLRKALEGRKLSP